MEVPPDKKAQGYTSWTPLYCDLPQNERNKLDKKKQKVVCLATYRFEKIYQKFLIDRKVL